VVCGVAGLVGIANWVSSLHYFLVPHFNLRGKVFSKMFLRANKRSHYPSLFLNIRAKDSTLQLWATRMIIVPSTLFREFRAISHTRLKALDHGNVRALIGRKGGDDPSSLHTRR
jgi:hypothetical protein